MDVALPLPVEDALNLNAQQLRRQHSSCMDQSHGSCTQLSLMFWGSVRQIAVSLALYVMA